MSVYVGWKEIFKIKFKYRSDIFKNLHPNEQTLYAQSVCQDALSFHFLEGKFSFRRDSDFHGNKLKEENNWISFHFFLSSFFAFSNFNTLKGWEGNDESTIEIVNILRLSTERSKLCISSFMSCHQVLWEGKTDLFLTLIFFLLIKHSLRISWNRIKATRDERKFSRILKYDAFQFVLAQAADKVLCFLSSFFSACAFFHHASGFLFHLCSFTSGNFRDVHSLTFCLVYWMNLFVNQV